MKQIVLFLFCMLFSVAVSAQDKKGTLSGKWEFSATDAPYGYDKGKVEFKTTQGKLSAIVNIQGNSISVSEIKKQADTYTCSFYVDGSQVEVTFKPKAEKLTATAKVDGSVLDVNFNVLK